jgi:hypothetical protein
MHGNPVFPMTIRKDIKTKGKVAFLNETIESGVRVYPRSLKAEPAVNIPHQKVLTPLTVTDWPNAGVSHIHETRSRIPRMWKNIK